MGRTIGVAAYSAHMDAAPAYKKAIKSLESMAGSHFVHVLTHVKYGLGILGPGKSVQALLAMARGGTIRRQCPPIPYAIFISASRFLMPCLFETP
jgi:hypothetical protein